MQVGEIVGLRIKEGREALSMTQDELGQHLEPYLGKAWSRQAVSLAEAGQRSFTAAELVALAHALGLPSGGWLISPPVDVREIELPSGKRLDPWLASDWAGAAGHDISEMAAAVAQLIAILAQAGEKLAAVASHLENVKAQLAQRHHDAGC